MGNLEYNSSRPAIEIDRLIRGCNPSPTAWTTVSTGADDPAERFRVGYARVADDTGLAPGEVRAEKRRVLVGTGSTALELVRVQPQGKKEMAGADWGRGLHDASARFA